MATSVVRSDVSTLGTGPSGRLAPRSGRGRRDAAGARVDSTAAGHGFERAATLLGEASDRPAEGAAHASLGRLRMRQGRNGEARASFERAAPLLLGGGERHELGLLACARAWLHLRDSDTEAARVRLREAEGLSSACGLGPGSPLAAAIAELSAEIEHAC